MLNRTPVVRCAGKQKNFHAEMLKIQHRKSDITGHTWT